MILFPHNATGVKGLIQARNTRFNFDATPATLDGLYLHRVDRAHRTSLMSLCPQGHKLGSSHFWEPSNRTVFPENANEPDALIDTDVSLTTDDESMDAVRALGHDTSMFFEHFASAYLEGYSRTGREVESLVTGWRTGPKTGAERSGIMGLFAQPRS